MLALA
jgi:hypothetical protein